jgi:hypothetical protein
VEAAFDQCERQAAAEAPKADDGEFGVVCALRHMK